MTPTDALREELLAQRNDLLEYWWSMHRAYPYWCQDCKSFSYKSECDDCGEKNLEQVKP